MIAAFVSEEVNHHTVSIKNTYVELKKLKDLYDSHSELEVVQLMVKLINLELKDDDPLSLASKIRAIMYGVDATIVKINIPLRTFVKALYPTYSHFLESVQASVQLKAITFDILVEKFAEQDKYFEKGKTTTPSSKEVVCLDKKEKN